MIVETRMIDNDTMIEVIVTQDGFIERGYVSSTHLVDTKVNQLKEAIAYRAASSMTNEHP